MEMVTWDTSRTGVTYSNNNLTALVPNASYTARATTSKSYGKWYWEITVDNVLTLMIGITNATGGTYTSANTMYYYNVSGNKWNGTNYAYGSSYTAGDTISVLLDMDYGTIEFWKNGDSLKVAFTTVNTLGSVFPSITTGSGSSGGTVTANFGASTFKYKIPKGYYSYDGSQYGSSDYILFASSDGEIGGITDLKYKTPIMTSYTEPSGEAKASSVTSNGNYPWKAFNGVTNGNYSIGWLSNGTSNQWLSYDFKKNTTIDTYEIFAKDNHMPKKFRFEGSNDEVNWTVLDIQDKSDWVLEAYNKFEISKENVRGFKIYRLFLENNNGGASYISIPDMKMSGTLRYLSKLSNMSEYNFRIHGINKDTKIDLSSSFEEIRIIEQSSSGLGSGKIFEQKIDLERYKVNKIKF